MNKTIRFGAYLREIDIKQRPISHALLSQRIAPDGLFNMPLRGIDTYRLLRSCLGIRLRDQLKAILPLAGYLVLFQLLILKQDVADAWVIGGGLLSVIVGLMLFMEGLKVGLMPFSETIGNTLSSRGRLSTVLYVIFLLGVGAAFAEPAIGALQAAGASVDVRKAPYHHALLNDWALALVLVIGLGVGLAAVLGALRILQGWSLRPLIYLTVIPTLAITVYCMRDPALRPIVGLAWDCGATAIGPVAAPLALALGIGMAGAAGKGRSSLSGFGIISLASILPVLGVLVLAMILAETASPEEIIAAAAARTQDGSDAWYATVPSHGILLGIRAILPLVLFLYCIQRYLLREKIPHRRTTGFGIGLAVLGLIVFNVGLSYGLNRLGGQSAGLAPATFTHMAEIPASPLYTFTIGIGIAALFAWFLGFGATMAEPALNALGQTVENLTNGALRKTTLMKTIAFGVAAGIAIGVIKIIFAIPLGWLLLPGYLLALLLTIVSSEEYVAVAWDSAGVTTGPVTMPLALTMGLGLGDGVGALEGFGILALAALFPILAVLGAGLRTRWKIRKRHAADAEFLEGEQTTLDLA
jgi:hypothetical protein